VQLRRKDKARAGSSGYEKRESLRKEKQGEGRFVNRPYGEEKRKTGGRNSKKIKMKTCGSEARSCGKQELTTPEISWRRKSKKKR
jgi:hypothetical protein